MNDAIAQAIYEHDLHTVISSRSLRVLNPWAILANADSLRQQAAHHLHEAHTGQEWLGCGLSSWSAYVQTIPLSRMYDWQLRFVHRSGVAGVSYSFRAAYREAKSQ
jgi:hypothetical protein